MMKNALYVQNEASKKYNPYVLKDYLSRTEDGTVIVDRHQLIKDRDDERLFYVILNKDYKWDYRSPEASTIYFKESNGAIWGGVYDCAAGIRSKVIVAVEKEIADRYDYNVYAYDRERILEIIDKINA